MKAINLEGVCQRTGPWLVLNPYKRLIVNSLCSTVKWKTGAGWSPVCAILKERLSLELILPLDYLHCVNFCVNHPAANVR